MGILDQYLEDYAKKAGAYNDQVAGYNDASGAYNDQVTAYNKTLQLGPDGKPIIVVNVKPWNGMSSPYYGGVPMYGNKAMDLLGYSNSEFDIMGNPAAQYGVNGQVYYTDYRTDRYSGQSAGGRDYYYIASKPSEISMASDDRVFYTAVENPEGGAPMYYTASNDPQSRYQPQYNGSDYDNQIVAMTMANGSSDNFAGTRIDVKKDPNTGQIYSGTRAMNWAPLPAKPGEFTQSAPTSNLKAPSFTIAEQEQLKAGRGSDDVVMGDAERGGNGIIARLLERKDEQD